MVSRRWTFSVQSGHTGGLLPEHGPVAAAASVSTLIVAFLHEIKIKSLQNYSVLPTVLIYLLTYSCNLAFSNLVRQGES